MKKIIKLICVVPVMMLTVAPITLPLANTATETVAKADSKDITYDVADNGPVSLGLTLKVDGQDQVVWTDMVYASKVGDIVTEPAPQIAGHVPSSRTISFLRTDTGYRFLTDLYYVKGDAKAIAANANTVGLKEIITVGNNDGSYSPLYGFSDDGVIYQISNRALANDTRWYSDKVKTYDAEKYYRVATNEWVKDPNVKLHEVKAGGYDN